MRITTRGEYALIALLDILKHSRNQTPVSLQDVAERQKIDLNYLEQIFKKLKAGEIVTSVRGPGGGYLLKTTPGKISILQVLNAMGEKIHNDISKKDTKENSSVYSFFNAVDTTLVKDLNTSLRQLSQF